MGGSSSSKALASGVATGVPSSSPPAGVARRSCYSPAGRQQTARLEEKARSSTSGRPRRHANGLAPRDERDRQTARADTLEDCKREMQRESEPRRPTLEQRIWLPDSLQILQRSCLSLPPRVVQSYPPTDNVLRRSQLPAECSVAFSLLQYLGSRSYCD